MIEAAKLTKRFGSKLAVDDLSFTVEKGDVLGFLGPNGAGKSTTMRMVTGFIPPTSGDAKICGISIVKDPAAAKRKIGYLPESAPLYNDMTVIGFLRFCAEIRGLVGAEKNEAVDRAIETCFLGTVARQSIDTLSKGYRHRTCLAQSLLHDPEVLILDEPTDGLDPNQKYEVRQLIKRLGETKPSSSPPTSSKKSKPPAPAPSSSTAEKSSPTAPQKSSSPKPPTAPSQTSSAKSPPPTPPLKNRNTLA